MESPRQIKNGAIAAKTSLDQLFLQHNCTVEDHEIRRAATHQFYCFAIEVGFGANAVHSKLYTVYGILYTMNCKLYTSNVCSH